MTVSLCVVWVNKSWLPPKGMPFVMSTETDAHVACRSLATVSLPQRAQSCDSGTQ